MIIIKIVILCLDTLASNDINFTHHHYHHHHHHQRNHDYIKNIIGPLEKARVDSLLVYGLFEGCWLRVEGWERCSWTRAESFALAEEFCAGILWERWRRSLALAEEFCAGLARGMPPGETSGSAGGGVLRCWALSEGWPSEGDAARRDQHARGQGLHRVRGQPAQAQVGEAGIIDACMWTGACMMGTPGGPAPA